jgi:hypothetical protein
MADHRWWAETYPQGRSQRTLLVDRDLLAADARFAPGRWARLPR